MYKFVDKLSADGGGDQAEAVADALQCAAEKMTWREGSLKLVLHILDEPPHGKQFEASGDDYPKGCPCGVSCEEMLKKLDKLDTQYLVLKFHNSTDKMVEVFKKYHRNLKGITLDVPAEKCVADTSSVKCKRKMRRKISGAEMPEPADGVMDKEKTAEKKEKAEKSKGAPEKEEEEEEELEERMPRSASFCAAENMVDVAAENVMNILSSNVGTDKSAK